MLRTLLAFCLATYLAGSYQGVIGLAYGNTDGGYSRSNKSLKRLLSVVRFNQNNASTRDSAAQDDTIHPVPSDPKPSADSNPKHSDPKLIDPHKHGHKYVLKPKSKGKPEETEVTVTFTHHITENETFVSDSPLLVLGNETYFLVHGMSPERQEEYVNDFNGYLVKALLSYCNGGCNIFSVNWTVTANNRSSSGYEGALKAGEKLAKVINVLRFFSGESSAITVIGHDLGNVVIAAAHNTMEKPFEHIFGLDQEILELNYAQYYLRKDMGGLVQTLYSKPFGFDYGHRNFFPNNGDIQFPDDYDDEDSFCYLCRSYKLFADDIIKKGDGHPHTFCSNYQDYESNFCENYSSVSIFNKKPYNKLPQGRYYTTEEYVMVDARRK